jgi:hypothetical protein
MNRRTSAIGLLAVAGLGLGCSLGEGDGFIRSVGALNVADCWNGPYRETALSIRVQHGGDIEEVSDGALILVDDIQKVRSAIAANPNATFRVGMPPGVVPPGFPIVADPNPPLVHLTLYLHRSCHSQNSALYSIDGSITFHALFDGDLNETNAAEKLTDAEFGDITVGDPRNRQPASSTVEDVSHILGQFKFYFQRGQPAQPFP